MPPLLSPNYKNKSVIFWELISVTEKLNHTRFDYITSFPYLYGSSYFFTCLIKLSRVFLQPAPHNSNIYSVIHFIKCTAKAIPTYSTFDITVLVSAHTSLLWSYLSVLRDEQLTTSHLWISRKISKTLD